MSLRMGLQLRRNPFTDIGTAPAQGGGNLGTQNVSMTDQYTGPVIYGNGHYHG